MSDEHAARDQSIADMYRDGVSLRTLEVAFGLDEAGLIAVLRREGVVEPEPGEAEDAFLERVKHDVKHA